MLKDAGLPPNVSGGRVSGIVWRERSNPAKYGPDVTLRFSITAFYFKAKWTKVTFNFLFNK